MIYFTSDLHFGHKNIIRYDNRPFTTVEQMDDELIKRWNNKIKDDDVVYILGDISWYNDTKTCDILSQLKGQKRLIKGNHDKISANIRKQFYSIDNYLEIVVDGTNVILCHYPITFFNSHHYGAYMLYGHVHNSHEWNFVESLKRQLEELDIKCNMFNVGCMLWNYEPVSLEEIKHENLQDILRNN